MKAFLIPGSGEDLKSRDYVCVLKMYKSLGYTPEFVQIDWRYKTVDDWVEQVKSIISEKDLQHSLLSGFSFGAIIALTIAAKTNPKQLLLFSLSPYFMEDMPLPKSYVKYAGKRRIETFKKLSFDKLAEQIKCATLIFLGVKEKQEYKDMWHRSSEAHKRIKSSELILVEDVGHDVGDPNYIDAIARALKNT